MEYTDIPDRISVVWASGVGSPYVNPIPETPSGDPGRAAFSTGFPALNFQSISSGGVPPFGGDFNGIVQLLTEQMQWAQAGMPPIFDATFQTAIGGYPLGAVVQSASDVTEFWQSQVNDNMADPDVPSVNWFRWPINPPLTVSMGGTGQVTFTSGNLLVGNGTGGIGEVAVLNTARGGTGSNSPTTNAVLIGDGTSPLKYSSSGVSTYPLIGTGGQPAFAALDINAVVPGGGSVNLSGTLPMPNAPVNVIAVYPTPGIFSFNVPANKFWLYVEVVGGGGGGAGENTGGPFTGGGGGSGGFAAGWVQVTPGASISVNVGAGGIGGISGSIGSSNGQNGSSTSFGGVISATGGNGGQSGANAAGGDGGVGSLSGSGVTQYGGYGTDGDIAGTGAFAGNGGASFYGGGLRAARGGPVATPAAAGSGGGGGYIGGDGSDGMPGMVVIRG